MTKACTARVDRNRFSRLFTVLDALIILSACGAFDLTFQLYSLENESRLLLFILTAVYVAFRLAIETSVRRSVIRQIGDDPLFWSLPAFTITWACFSSSWSESLFDTLLSSCAFAATLATGIYLGYAYSINALLRLVGYCLSLTLLASVIVCLFLPETGIMQSPQFDALHDFRWRGIYKHKNWLGLFSGLSCVIFCALVFSDKTSSREKYFFCPMIFLGLLTLYKAESTTALLALTICAVIFCFTFANNSARRSTLNTLVLLTLFLPFSYSAGKELMGSGINSVESSHGFTRTMTFSGRVPHWQSTLEVAAHKPVTGFGYDSFWHSSHSNNIHAKNGWIAVQAHSGWIEAILDLGWPVAITFILWMFWSFFRYIDRWRLSRNTEALTISVIFTFIFVSNCTESLLPNHSGLLMVLFTAFSYLSVPNKASKTVTNSNEVLESDTSAI